MKTQRIFSLRFRVEMCSALTTVQKKKKTPNPPQLLLVSTLFRHPRDVLKGERAQGRAPEGVGLHQGLQTHPVNPAQGHISADKLSRRASSGKGRPNPAF